MGALTGEFTIIIILLPVPSVLANRYLICLFNGGEAWYLMSHAYFSR